MYFKQHYRQSALLALALAIACVPVTKIALMYWEYSLRWPLPALAEPIALFLALALAVFAASYFPGSWLKKLGRIAALGVWSCLAYFMIVFVPGCMWAPACL